MGMAGERERRSADGGYNSTGFHRSVRRHVGQLKVWNYDIYFVNTAYYQDLYHSAMEFYAF